MSVAVNRRRAGSLKVIEFADPEVKRILVENWGGADGGTAANNTRVGGKKVKGKAGEMTYKQAASVLSIDNVFRNNTTITSFNELIYFTSIPRINGAFIGCTNLTSIKFPSKSNYLNNYTFQNCTNLKRINSDIDGIANLSNLTQIPTYCFYNCKFLVTINIPDSVTDIGGYAFANCTGLKNINTRYITNLAMSAFHGCTELEEIDITNVTSIGNGCFRSCTNLKRINSSIDGIANLPSTQTIGNNCFQGCNSLSTINIPNSVTSIGFTAFAGCTNLTTINIPDSVTSIGDDLFNLCRKLENVQLGSGITIITSKLFYFCDKITNISIPNNVTSIQSEAFEYCVSLQSIDIPSNVTSIGNNAFKGCGSMNNLICRAIVPPTIAETIGLDNPSVIYVPAASVDAYKAADGWSNYASKIEALPS